MSNLSNILNPETTRNRPQSVHVPVTVSYPPPVPSALQHHQEIDTRPRPTATWEHAPHPDCPDTLSCLPDTEGRPQHTLPVILRCAILGSPRKRLTIREIYAAMEEKYAYYRTAGPTWKQSVRHHLSLNRLFERQPRPVTDPGFGSYWTVNLQAPPGTKRPRKRGRGNKDANKAAANAAANTSTLASPTTNQTQSSPHPTPSSSSTHAISPATLIHPPPPPEPEGAGPSSFPRARPRNPSAGRGSTPLSSHDGEEEDDESVRYGDAPPESGDEYESDEEFMDAPQFDRRNSYPVSAYAPPPRANTSFSLPPIASLDKGPAGSSEDTVERLQTEIDTLRRQSAEAVSVSLRLSEQLAQAQAEVSRSRATVRNLEDRLHDESSRRREAERQASEEIKRRRMTEEAYGMGRSPDRSRPL